jgi:hypothetical protein
MLFKSGLLCFLSVALLASVNAQRGLLRRLRRLSGDTTLPDPLKVICGYEGVEFPPFPPSYDDEAVTLAKQCLLDTGKYAQGYYSSPSKCAASIQRDIHNSGSFQMNLFIRSESCRDVMELEHTKGMSEEELELERVQVEAINSVHCNAEGNLCDLGNLYNMDYYQHIQQAGDFERSYDQLVEALPADECEFIREHAEVASACSYNVRSSPICPYRHKLEWERFHRLQRSIAGNSPECKAYDKLLYNRHSQRVKSFKEEQEKKAKARATLNAFQKKLCVPDDQLISNCEKDSPTMECTKTMLKCLTLQREKFCPLGTLEDIEDMIDSALELQVCQKAKQEYRDNINLVKTILKMEN